MNAFGSISRNLRAPIGNGLDNDPNDIRKTKDQLSAAGYLKEEPRHDFITRDTDTAIRSFQQDNDLKEDGVMNPGGETERALFQKAAAPAIPPLAIQLGRVLGMTAAKAWKYYKSQSKAKQADLCAQANKSETKDVDSEEHKRECYEEYEDDAQRCNEVTQRKGSRAGRLCFSEASETLARCLRTEA